MIYFAIILIITCTIVFVMDSITEASIYGCVDQSIPQPHAWQND